MNHKCVICGIRSEEIAKRYKVSLEEAEKVFEMHHISYSPIEKKVLLCAYCHNLVTLSDNFRKKHQRNMENNVSEIIDWKLEMTCLDCEKKLETINFREVNGNPRFFCPFCDSNEINFRRIKAESETK